MNEMQGCKMIRMKGVIEATGLSRSAIYQKVAAGQFPKQVKLGERSVGWLVDEVVGWLNKQISMSRSEQRL